MLVVDNHSVDETDGVVAGIGDSRVHLLKIHNEGVIAKSRNFGIENAQGAYIAFLDSDDWWTSEKLKQSVKALDSGGDVIYHDLFIAVSQEQTNFTKRLVSSEPIFPMFSSLLCTGMSIPNSSVVVRRELLTKIGGLSENPDLIATEDYDTWIRLSRLTEQFVRLPECLGYYWMGGGNASAASPRQLSRIKALYAQYLDDLPAFERNRAEGFLAYRVGRISQAHRDHRGAAASFRKAMSCPIDSSYRLKALLFFLVCLKKGWFL